MKTLAALLAALPLAALAQQAPPPAPPGYAPTAQPAPPPPPPGYAPVPPPPPAGYAPPAATSGPRRDSWYIGFGLGGGDGNVAGQGDSFSFSELNGGGETTVFLNFKVGATLSPKLLLGFDVSAIRSASDSGGISSAVQVTNYDAMLTFFPMEKGFFLKGGAGYSALRLELGSASSTYGGFNLTGGLGYAFWIGKSFNLTLNLDYSGQAYGDSPDEPESSNFWTVWLGFDWY